VDLFIRWGLTRSDSRVNLRQHLRGRGKRFKGEKKVGRCSHVLLRAMRQGALLLYIHVNWTRGTWGASLVGRESAKIRKSLLALNLIPKEGEYQCTLGRRGRNGGICKLFLGDIDK